MILKLPDVLDEYPNPFFLIRPLTNGGESEDFEYLYVNRAFCNLVQRRSEELVGRTYCDAFQMRGERAWLDLFLNIARGQRHAYVDSISTVINKKLFTEAFHVSPDLCACIIHDYVDMSEGLHFQDNQELLKKAHHDYLTGFYNRFYLVEQYEKDMPHENVGVTVMDINNLKRMNDTYGHAAGDELILRVAHMIRAMYPDSAVFRMGGDEFVVVTLGMERDEFMAMSRCRRAVFEMDDVVAIGYGYFTHMERLKDCIDRCDDRMYTHKRQRKQNRQE
jgi:diguanylate cyclase (GGDEF)-like protein